VAVGHVPPELAEFFDSSVTVAFERDGSRRVAAVEADDDTVDKFSTVLFKTILNGTEVTVKHPARVGGRVTGAEFVPARLLLKPRTVRFDRPNGRLDLELSTVTGFDRARHEVGGRERPVLEIRHTEGGQSTMTLVAVDSARKLAIFGRYLRLEYSELVEQVREIDLSGDETELLVALYSGAGESLSGVIGADASQVTMLRNRLAEKGLVTDAGGETGLTPKGRVVVSNYLEEVNG
jgi:helix-turn-helix protein